jgi:hypothetical protein
VTSVYDHDPEEVAALGWAEFVARQWESIFAGYRARAGLRRICRRWSDLLEVGLGCPQNLADLLVRTEIIDRADRDLEGIADAADLVAGMAAVLADVRSDLLELAGMGPGGVAGASPATGAQAGLLEAHAGLLSFIRDYAFGTEDPGPALS